MNEKEIQRFKSEIKRYRYLVATVEIVKEKLDLCLYEMSGVKGVSYDKIRATADESSISMKKLEMIEQYNRLVKMYERKMDRLNYIEKVLSKMNEDDRELYEMKYIDGKSFEHIAKKIYISKSGLIYRMNEILKGIEL